VFVPLLEKNAEVIELISSQMVRVAIGTLTIKVQNADLRQPHKGGPTPREAGASGASAAPLAPELQAKMRQVRKEIAPTEENRSAQLGVNHAPVRRTPALPSRDNTCDVRGMSPIDACSVWNEFFRQAHEKALSTAYILHGYGTLRDAIRAELRGTRAVQFFQGAEPSDGGDGATIVWLAHAVHPHT
jgi:DNA-nicking Smr family endonuclease